MLITLVISDQQAESFLVNDILFYRSLFSQALDLVLGNVILSTNVCPFFFYICHFSFLLCTFTLASLFMLDLGKRVCLHWRKCRKTCKMTSKT